MNKSLVRNILIVVACAAFLPCLAYAEAIHKTDDPANASCVSCHTIHKSLGGAGYSGLNHICLNCHRPGRIDRSYGQIAPFTPGDMATVDGPSRGKKDPKMTKSSHRWDGSDDVPKLGALPPTNPVMSGTMKPNIYVGKLACNRCHSIHVSTTNNFPRVSFDNDVICLDCHRPRDTNDHITGTHPVNVNYATIAAAAPAEYNNPPLNSNPSNPTSAMQLKGTNGNTVLCTTCHSVHFSDSNSSTFDNRSSAIFNRLSTSAGYLLKTDIRGASATAINICTNCHKTYDSSTNPGGKVANHNGSKNQNIQCSDCHGGHVDEADGTTPNVFLIRRYMNVSSASGRTPKVMFTDSTVTGMNYAKDDYGVCVACHKDLPASVPQHTDRANTQNCKGCHTHKAGFSANCTSCHGMPPVANTPGGPSGYANQPFNYAGAMDESQTPHASHATNSANAYSYACLQCHNGYMETHASGTFQDVFKDTVGIIASTKGATPTYSSGTCSTMYCHSSGAGGDYKSVSWANTKGTIIGQSGECSACHNFPATTTSHTKHVSGGTTGKAYSCTLCHSAVISSSNVIIAENKTMHVNGTADVALSGTEGSITVTACTSCHNDGRSGSAITAPVWGSSSTGACGACHKDSAGMSAADATRPTYGHPGHLAAVYGPQFGTANIACQQCHISFTGELGATHVNGTRDFAESSCVPCHPDSDNTYGGYPWTGSVKEGTLTQRVTCNSCHSTNTLSSFNNISAPSTRLAATKGHGKPDGANKACTFCHDNTRPHLISNPADPERRLQSFLTTPANLNQSCNYCHNDLVRVNNKPKFLNMSTHFTVYNGPADMSCAKCHDLHGSNNLSMIRDLIVDQSGVKQPIIYTNRDTQWVNNVTNRGLCQVCHVYTKYYKAGVPETSHPTEGCFACHPHNAAGGAFLPSGSCNACHGYPPVPKSFTKGAAIPYGSPGYKTTFGVYNNYTNAKFEDYSGGGGAHLNHVPSYAKATEGWKNCGICHNDGNIVSSSNHVTRLPLKENISNVTIKVAQYVNFNNTALVTYTGSRRVNPPAVNNTGSCINVGCHFQPTPRWSKDR